MDTAKSGFTLMELLLVVSLVMLVSGGTYINLKRNYDKGKDAERKSDLQTLSRAFEEYYNDHNCYPSVEQWQTAVCESREWFLSPYLPQFPCDPERRVRYVYIPTDTQSNPCSGSCGECYAYALYTVLSDKSDPDIAGLDCDGPEGCGYTDELGRTVNYGVSVGGVVLARRMRLSEFDLSKEIHDSIFNDLASSRQHTPTPTRLPPDNPVVRKVMVIDYNPVFEARGFRTLRGLYGWTDPQKFEDQFIENVASASGGYLTYQVVERHGSVDAVPPKEDGYVYTDETYLNVMEGFAGRYEPDTPLDYQSILSAYNICDKRNTNELHEVWIWGGPNFGMMPSVMAGANSFYMGGPPIDAEECTKPVFLMGFRYDQELSDMLETFGNRAEQVLTFEFSEFNRRGMEPQTDWGRFTKIDALFPKDSACGLARHAPNALKEYDWYSTRTVLSSCNQWMYYPQMSDEKRLFHCSEWGCTKYGYYLWWMSHLPRSEGVTDGNYNNWWKYIVADY